MRLLTPISKTVAKFFLSIGYTSLETETPGGTFESNSFFLSWISALVKGFLILKNGVPDRNFAPTSYLASTSFKVLRASIEVLGGLRNFMLCVFANSASLSSADRSTMVSFNSSAVRGFSSSASRYLVCMSFTSLM